MREILEAEITGEARELFLEAKSFFENCRRRGVTCLISMTVAPLEEQVVDGTEVLAAPCFLSAGGRSDDMIRMAELMVRFVLSSIEEDE